MPGKVKVKIISGRNLPVMDRSSDTTDAYVEIKLGNTTYKTDVCRRSLHPKWNSEWYRFEVDDSELQDEPLQIRLMDHDTYSANDAIGKVYLDLNPLLLPAANVLLKYGWNGETSANNENSSNSVMSGWIPVYDTMHGIRGEVNIIVKVELFSDFNKFRQSSCGVQFFCSSAIPYGYYAQVMHGFVEELVVNDDPEYQWIDKIRTPRASNEARQTLFFKLSGELQRKIGVKALDLGANAVVGYNQCFDLEGESGIVARGIGTAVTLVKILDAPQPITIDSVNEERVLSYLNFLGSKKDFHLNEPCNLRNFLTPSFQSKFWQTAVNFPDSDPRKKQLIRHLSHTDFNKPTFDTSLHHSSSLQTLLRQEDMRGTATYGISKKIKNLKYSSQSMLSKKMTAIKAKLSDQDDYRNLSAPTLDLVEIKKKKPFMFRRAVSNNDSSVMAELLVRSVIRAHQSLDSIMEVHDTDPINELQPNEDLLNKTASDASSSTESSTSDEDDDENLSESKDSNVEFDTVSNIVKNVEIIERKLSLENHHNDEFIDEINQMPSVLSSSELKSESLVHAAMQTILLEKVNIMGTYTPPVSPSFIKKLNAFDVSSNASSSSSVTKLELDESFFPKITRTFESLKKSSSVVSLSEIELKNKPVINTTFSSAQNIKSSDVNLQSEKLTEQEIASTPNLQTTKEKQTNRNDVKLKRSKSYDFFKRKMSVFSINKDKNGNAVSSIKRRFGKFFTSRMKRPSQGLLGAALGNVVMETVQDILATSHSKNNKDPKSLPQSSILTTNAQQTPPDVLINTEIDESSNSNIKLHASLTPSHRNSESPVREHKEQGHQRAESVGGTKIAQSPAKLNMVPCIHRRSSDSDLSITPKGNSLTGSDRSGGGPMSSHCMRTNQLLRPTLHQDNFDMLEYPFLTMSKYPPGFISYLGGAVSARSVKLLERITNLEEPESRDMWWSEIRLEIRSHARALNCNAVLGYVENTSICEDVCVLSASGTAAIIGFNYKNEIGDIVGNLPVIPKSQVPTKDIMTTSLDRNEFEKENIQQKACDSNTTAKQLPESPDNENTSPFLSNNCSLCHLPYNKSAIPLRITTSQCAKCRYGKVPDVLIATVEMPDQIPTIGRGCFLQSYVCRPLKDSKGESNAKEISDGLPFLEYELHRLLMNKLKIKGMNSIFGLKVKITIGEKLLVGVATGTAVFLSPLPVPQIPKLVSDRSLSEKKLAELQKHLNETIRKNREIYQIKTNDDFQNGRILSDDDSEDEQPTLDLSVGNKDCCILEVDDPEDFEVLKIIMEAQPPDGFHVVNTEHVPGLEELEIVKNLQMFTQIWRVRLHPKYKLDRYFHRLLQSVYFKLRRMIPCALCDLQFRVDLPEPDELQLSVVGMALGLGDSQKHAVKYKRKNPIVRKNDDDMIFNLEEDQIPEHSVASSLPTANQLHAQTLKYRQKSPQRRFFATKQRHVPHRERHGVDITPLSYVPGGKIERYLGNLNFFFIRETTSIREEGGLSGFIHSFVTEVLAIVRAHVMALGGNAMVAYFMTECVLNHSLHKNQGQCLINVGGDVVFVSYFNEEP